MSFASTRFCCYSVDLAKVHAVKQHAEMMTHICKSLYYQACEYLDHMICSDLVSSLYIQFVKIIEHPSNRHLHVGPSGNFVSFKTFAVPVVSRHMSPKTIKTMVLCSFTGDTNLNLQPLQVEFFHTLARNVTCQIKQMDL